MEVGRDGWTEGGGRGMGERLNYSYHIWNENTPGKKMSDSRTNNDIHIYIY